MSREAGITGQRAPELRVPIWLSNVEGELRIADLDVPVVYLYSFQSWCPGCHRHGFPTLKKVKSALESKGLAGQVRFVAVQTVFEGHDQNTPEAARRSVADHGLVDIPLGHDAGDPPGLMVDYRAGGTPWTVIIGPRPDRTVLYNDFHADPAGLLRGIERTLAVT